MVIVGGRFEERGCVVGGWRLIKMIIDFRRIIRRDDTCYFINFSHNLNTSLLDEFAPHRAEQSGAEQSSARLRLHRTAAVYDIQSFRWSWCCCVYSLGHIPSRNSNQHMALENRAPAWPSINFPYHPPVKQSTAAAVEDIPAWITDRMMSSIICCNRTSIQSKSSKNQQKIAMLPHMYCMSSSSSSVSLFPLPSEDAPHGHTPREATNIVNICIQIIMHSSCVMPGGGRFSAKNSCQASRGRTCSYSIKYV